MAGIINTKTAYGAALLAAISGIYVSMTTGDWSWLSRSGSLLVIIGIVLTSNQIIEHNRLRKSRRFSIGHTFCRYSSAQQMAREWTGAHGLVSLAKARVREEDSWAVEGHGLYMLVAGTLVWGFGDLVGNVSGV